jgi:hypothetical protein
MRRPAALGAVVALFAAASCAPAWKHAGGERRIPPARFDLSSPREGADKGATAGPSGEAAWTGSASRPVSFVLPPGWHWYDRGEELIATKDGVFLQHLFLERLHVDQVDQEVDGFYPQAAFSATAWPTRTARSLSKRFAAGMAPTEAAEVLLASRRNDPALADLQVLRVGTCTVAGRQAFRAEFVFRLKATPDPMPVYRSVYCGFVLDDWFYGVGYTAARRHYFGKDEGAFESFLASVRIPGT